MRKLQIQDPEVMRIAIQQEIGRSEESRYDHRLHGLLLVSAGQSCRQVAELFGEDGTTVQRWVRRFEQGWRRCGKASGRDGRARSMRRNGADCRPICARRRASSVGQPHSGMVRCCPNTCVGATGSIWG